MLRIDGKKNHSFLHQPLKNWNCTSRGNVPRPQSPTAATPSGIGTGVQAVQWTGAPGGTPSSWGPRVVGPQKNFRQGKINKIVATRWRILRLKCIKFDFGRGSAPDPAREAYIAPPDPVAGFGGALRGRGRGWAGEEEWKGRGKGGKGKWRGGKGRASKLLLNQGPSEPCYATGDFTAFNYMTEGLTSGIIALERNHVQCEFWQLRLY